jgi:ferredoxin
MPKVTFMPGEVAVEVKEGTSIFAAALEADVELESQCGGRCGCALCRVKLLDGLDNVSSMEWEETAHLGTVFHVTHERLACQTRVSGDVVIGIPETVERAKKAYVPHKYKKNAQQALLARIAAQESEVDSQRTVKGKQRSRRRRGSAEGPPSAEHRAATPSSGQHRAAPADAPEGSKREDRRRPQGPARGDGRPRPAQDGADPGAGGEGDRPRRRRRRRRRKPRGGGGKPRESSGS